MVPMDDEAQLRAELEATWVEFGHHERRALVGLAKRILLGQKRYALFNPRDGRDFRKERGEEFQDALVYTIFEELVLLEKARQS